jgi:NADPH:quinone reductase-like Zn-dependent oxidoreductase
LDLIAPEITLRPLAPIRLITNRLLYGLLTPQKKILGSDIAGRIEAVGRNVEHFLPGDEVYGDLSGDRGGFAEYVCARENALALKLASMTFTEAAAIHQAAMLAIQGLRDKRKIQQGQKLLINGASGGVGAFAVQIAKLFGIEVTGVDSSGKLDMLRSIGFDYVLMEFMSRLEVLWLGFCKPYSWSHGFRYSVKRRYVSLP